MTGRRDGIALIAVVLALVVLEAAIAGALYLAAVEVRTTRTLAAHARANRAAESAIAAATAAWDADALARLALHDTASMSLGTMPFGAKMRARIEHVTPAAYVISATGTAPAPATLAVAHASALVRWLAPAAFAASVPAALSVGGTATVLGGAIVDGSLTTTTCATADSLARATFAPAAGIAAAHAGATTIGPGATVVGSPPTLIAPPLAPHAFALLGPLDTAQLRRAADRVESGSLMLAPQPAATGTTAPCDTAAAANWGAPSSPGHACADYVPIVYAPGDLTLGSGAGQALLVVAGNLTIDSIADFHGVAIVLGNTTILGRAHGALRVRGDAVIHGVVRRDPCALWLAFTRPNALAHPRRPLPRWRLPAF